MAKPIFLLPFLAVLPLAAQTWEAGLFLGQQTYKAGAISGTNVSGTYATPAKTVVAVRAGYALFESGPWFLQGTAAFQPQVTSTQTQTEVQAQPIIGSTTHYKGSFDAMSGYSAVGVMVNFKAMVSAGAGLEYRLERLSGLGVDANYGRPWFRGNVGLALPTPLVECFLGLEAAFPLVSKSSYTPAALGFYGTPDAFIPTTTSDSLKASAPKGQVGAYLGMRF